jgi:hypothetical protein
MVTFIDSQDFPNHLSPLDKQLPALENLELLQVTNVVVLSHL